MMSCKRRLYEKGGKISHKTTHLVFIKEKVMMMDIRKNPKVIATIKLTFTGASKSNRDYLMREKRKMEKNSYATRKKIKNL